MVVIRYTPVCPMKPVPASDSGERQVSFKPEPCLGGGKQPNFDRTETMMINDVCEHRQAGKIGTQNFALEMWM